MTNYYENESEDLSILNEMAKNGSNDKANDISAYTNNLNDTNNPLNMSKVKKDAMTDWKHQDKSTGLFSNSAS